MKNKVIKRCIELLEEIQFLTNKRKIYNNCNYVITGLKINLEQNNVRGAAVLFSKKEKFK